MKTKVSKILLVLLLILLPAISPTYNVHAERNCIYVHSSIIDFSPDFLLDSHNLNSLEMKRYLIKRIEFSEVLPKRRIEQIKAELDHVSFFCFRSQLYDDVGSAIIHMWIPNDTTYLRSPGEFFSFPMKYV